VQDFSRGVVKRKDEVKKDEKEDKESKRINKGCVYLGFTATYVSLHDELTCLSPCERTFLQKKRVCPRGIIRTNQSCRLACENFTALSTHAATPLPASLLDHFS